MIANILIWWLTLQLFGLLGLPLTQWLFRALPDRGYAFSKSLGLLLAGYLAWLLAMLGLAPFGRALVLICALAVGAIGLLLIRQPPNGGPAATTRMRLARLGEWLAQSWRQVLVYEVIFALAFVALLRLRGYNDGVLISPNPYGTERPMDYALFNAIRASTNFPPHDPWLAGFSINYYYFGYLLMAVISLASGVGEGLAYNLSLASIFALTALGVAGIVVNLILLTENREPRTENQKARDTRLPRGSWFAVLLTIVLVLGAGNQGGALQVISGVKMILALDGADMARALANGVGARQPLALDPPFRGFDFDGTSTLTPEDALADFNWWNPSRALWDSYPPAPDDPDGRPSKRYDITEFPFFSFWLGDMHPHVMSLPFGLLALALALATLARRSAPHYTAGSHGWAELVLTGIILGSLYLINSWDLPTYVLLFLGALLILYARLGQANMAPDAAPAAPLAGIWWQHYATQAITALLAAWVLFAPFHLTFRSLVGGRGLPIGLYAASRTPLHMFLIIFGLFLLPLLAYVFVQGQLRGTGNAQATRPLAPALWRYGPWIVLGVLLLGIVIGFPLLALLPLAIYAGMLALERADCPAAAFVLWGFALACLVCLGTEIVYIRDVFEGSSARMNTIFKFYYQVWVIWSVLAGYAVWWLAARWGVGTLRRLNVGRLSLIPLAILFAVLLTGALVYPWLTAGKMMRAGEWLSIAGDTPREHTPDGAAGIAWLRANVPGDAVVLEAVGDSYDSGYSGLGFGQVSGSTGRPTVLGWPGHEDQWRGGDPAAQAQIAPRKEDVKTIYSSTDPGQAGELLKKYNVDYIYVGAAERATYPAEGLAKLAQLGDAVFQQGEVAIYRVRK